MSVVNGVKISALPAADVANDADQLEVNQGGVSRRVTALQLRNYIASEGAGVATLAALTALIVPYPALVTTQCRSTAGDQGGGTWVFVPGNQSYWVTFDTLSGLWAAPDSDATGASGAWQRQFNGPAYLRWFGLTLSAATDQVPIINAAILACEISDIGKLCGPAGRIRCDSSILLGRYGSISFEGPGISRSYPLVAGNASEDVMFLDFDNAPANTTAINIGAATQTTSLTRLGTGIRFMTIARYATPNAAGAGGIGILMNGIIDPHMEDIHVYGFDTGSWLRTNAGMQRACFRGLFVRCQFRMSGNYATLIESAVDCTWFKCNFLEAEIASVWITHPATVPPDTYNTYSSGNFFDECIFIGAQGPVSTPGIPENNILINSGFGHWFNNCAMEQSVGPNIKAKLPVGYGHGASRHLILMENCWINQGTGDGCLELDDCSFQLVNSRFERSYAATGAGACIRVGMNPTIALGTYGSTIAGCGIYYTAKAGIEVGTYDMLKVNGCTFYEEAAGVPAIILGATAARNSFIGNTMNSTHATGWVNNASIVNGNVFQDNIVESTGETTNAIADYDYRRSNGGVWRSISTDFPRTQHIGTSQSSAGHAWKRYSADSGGVFTYYYKSRSATDSGRGAAITGDSVALHRYYADDGTTDNEVARQTYSVDGTNGGAWAFALKADGGAITSRMSISNAGVGTYVGSWTVSGQVTGQSVKTGIFTVGTLPALSGAARAYVTDSTVTLVAGHGLVVAGTGANHCPVYCDGGNWRIG